MFPVFRAILEGGCKKGLILFPHFYRFRFGTYEYFVFKDFHPLASVSASVFLFLPVLVNVYILGTAAAATRRCMYCFHMREKRVPAEDLLSAMV